jgi:hypothetical protein
MLPGSTLAFWQGLPAGSRLRYAPYLFRVNLAARRPHMYGLRRHKRMVLERFGLAGLAILMSEMLDHAPPAGLARLPVVGLQAYAQAQGEAYDVIASPRQVLMHLPRIIGAAPRPPLAGESRTFFRCVLKDAVVAGKSNAIAAPQVLLMDFQRDEREQLPSHLDFNFPVLDELDGVATMLDPRPGRQPIPVALKLTGAQTANFGHWTMEYMFQLWACLQQPGFAGVTILIDAQMPPQHREAVEFFAGPGHPILTLRMGEEWPVARLWTCAKVVYWPGGEKTPVPAAAATLFELADAELLAGMIRQLQPRLDSVRVAGDAPARLFLSRAAGQSREMEDRAGLQRFFEGRGYTVIDPAGLSFLDQLRYLRGASTVVVEAGSSVYSLIYGRPGLRIGYFPTYDPPELECIHEVFVKLGHTMLALAPPGDAGNTQAVDYDMLARLVDEVELL